MSYCRFSKYSDVYVYPTPDGKIVCDECILNPKWKYSNAKEMLDHLKCHIQIGHKVPRKAIEKLETEIKAIT